MMFIIKSLLWLVVLILGLGALWSWQMQHGAQEKAFLAGTVPSPLPDGLYTGTVPGFTVSWKGKKFTAADNIGINVFDDGERYPFTTSVGKGLTDKDIDVLKIDYASPSNPFWLRPLLDEVVQISPDHYLGKLQIRLLPGYPFTLGYFELQK